MIASLRPIAVSIFMAVAAVGHACAQTRPNILLIYSDDHTWQAIGSYKSWLGKAAKTPNLDKLAAQGMRFDRALVTNAICGPARAVVQTGKYSHMNGFTVNEVGAEPAGSDRFDGSQQTFPKLLRQGGYQTAVIGKWHLVSDPQGFDHWDILPDQGAYYGPQFIQGNAAGRIAGMARALPGHNTNLVADLSLAWLRSQRDISKPFMLMTQFKATHREWEPGPAYLGRFDTVAIPEPPDLFDDYAFRGSAAHLQDMSIRKTMNQTDLKLAQPPDWNAMDAGQKSAWTAYYDQVKADFAARKFTFGDTADTALVRWKFRRYIRDYLSVAAQMDDNIGRLMAYLDSSGLAANTVVIYSSDQGFYLGEHGWFDKRFMYEQSLRAPLMVRWPGQVAAGSVNRDLVSNVDFAETFLDLAGITVPSDMQGRSLVPLFKGNNPPDWRKAHYYQYYEYPAAHHVYPHYGLATDRYKLIRFHCVDEWEFYDLKKDPGESVNQASIPANAAILADLKSQLTAERARLKVTRDAPCDGSMLKVALQVRTAPLPLKGCTDPKFAEYDPEATESLAGACLTPSTAAATASGRPIGWKVRYLEGKVILEAPLSSSRAAVSIHRMDGTRLADLRADAAGRFEWDASASASPFIAEARDGGRVRYLKLVK